MTAPRFDIDFIEFAFLVERYYTSTTRTIQEKYITKIEKI